ATSPSHGAYSPGRAFGVRPDAPEHVGRLGIFPESKKGLSTCRRVKPRATRGQVSQNALAYLLCAFATLGRPVARPRKQILEEGRIDVRVGVVPQFVFGCALIELCRLHQVFQLAEIIPPAFTDAARDTESFFVAGKLSIFDKLEFAGEEVELFIMTGGRIELRVFARQQRFLTAEGLFCRGVVWHTIAEAERLFAQLTKHLPR